MSSMEVLGLKDTSTEEFHCEFMDRLERLPGGTYMTELPWKESAGFLPTNKALASARLTSTVRRLEKLGRIEEYDKIMKEQLHQGIIEKVPYKPTGEVIHWIPHQAVIRDNAESTKLRIVYDCSAKSTSKDP